VTGSPPREPVTAVSFAGKGRYGPGYVNGLSSSTEAFRPDAAEAVGMTASLESRPTLAPGTYLIDTARSRVRFMRGMITRFVDIEFDVYAVA
jgi:hypothetical protein